MAERLVVADASPLIGLATAGAFDLLRGLFGQIAVTARVRDEVLAGGDLPGAPELARAIREGWVKVEQEPADATEFPDLDAGEATTLALAILDFDRKLPDVLVLAARLGGSVPERTVCLTPGWPTAVGAGAADDHIGAAVGQAVEQCVVGGADGAAQVGLARPPLG